ncbi:unnamed protein product [Tilletia caries]|uniref:Uncharacterized protein n=3 Tax=Tilletia TaxID=13289 RepID=A0A8X7MNW7_9BASI|nr:hypothetical protein CF336_g4814 [Tilletia laevis]KAE8242759.1 hypothetical protein A4X06_0g6769 [Tilletia controversa]CAD6890284.1 unnamed protein product [Tilletia caries]CAD7067513.1 unnamed protein product [Tilletia caries]
MFRLSNEGMRYYGPDEWPFPSIPTGQPHDSDDLHLDIGNMAGLDEVRTLWLLGSNPHTRQRSRSPSPPLAIPTLAGIDASLPPGQQTRLADAALRKAARQTHLPSRGPSYQRERMARAVYGYPPFGTNADADQLSEEEIILEQRKEEQINFGYRHYVQIGERRTAFEEELSNEEEDYPPGDASRTTTGGAGPGGRSHRARRGRQTGNTTNSAGAGPGANNTTMSDGGDSSSGGEEQVQPATVAAAQRTAAAAAAAASQLSMSMDSDFGSQQAPDLDADIEDLD